jgi:hypothetical protein
VFPCLTGFDFVGIAARLRLYPMHAALKLAAAIWRTARLPLSLTNAAGMKLHREFVASDSAGHGW